VNNPLPKLQKLLAQLAAIRGESEKYDALENEHQEKRDAVLSAGGFDDPKQLAALSEASLRLQLLPACRRTAEAKAERLATQITGMFEEVSRWFTYTGRADLDRVRAELKTFLEKYKVDNVAALDRCVEDLLAVIPEAQWARDITFSVGWQTHWETAPETTAERALACWKQYLTHAGQGRTAPKSETTPTVT
jgi:hypothetical protein